MRISYGVAAVGLALALVGCSGAQQAEQGPEFVFESDQSVLVITMPIGSGQLQMADDGPRLLNCWDASVDPQAIGSAHLNLTFDGDNPRVGTSQRTEALSQGFTGCVDDVVVEWELERQAIETVELDFGESAGTTAE